MDENNRIFIDRDGKLFAILLDCMRNCGKRPLQSTIEAVGAHQLLQECEFFIYDSLAQKICGKISPFDMRYQDRVIRENELMDNTINLCDLFQMSDISSKPRESLELPLLFNDTPQPVAQCTYLDFCSRLDKFTGGLLEDLNHIPGVVIAGGAVIGALTGTEAGDIDIFFVGANANAMSSFRLVLSAVQKNQAARRGLNSRLLVTRSSCAVTMYRTHLGKMEENCPPVQFITSTYKSTNDLLSKFDIESRRRTKST